MEAHIHASDVTGDNESRLYRKVTLRLVPFLFLCYLAAYLDRVNVGFAKLRMLEDLSFSESVYGLGAGIFFVGYVLFEVPSNLALHRVGAKWWIARIMITWGLLSGATAFVTTPTSFYVLRFLLGAAEAGFIPGVLLYLTYWYPSAWRGRITSLFLTAIPMTSVLGGPLSGWILEAMSGVGRLAGWQWLFIVEMIPSLIMGVLTIVYLDNRVADAKWLSADEKALLARRLAEDENPRSEQGNQAKDALTDLRVWLLGLIYFCIASGIYIVSFWLPTLIRNTGVANPFDVGLLAVVPYGAAAIAMVWWNARADRRRERRWSSILPCLICASGLAMAAMSSSSTPLTVTALTFAAAGASTAQAAFLTLPTALLGGTAVAVGIALVNSLGNIAGLTSTALVGLAADVTGSPLAGFYVVGAILSLGSLLILLLPARSVNR